MECASYADDTTPYTYGQSFDEIIEKLEIDMYKICEWFHYNGFKANPGKFFFFAKPIRRLTNKNKGILFEVRIDSDQSLKEHNQYCSKANQKVHALIRIFKYTSLQKRRILTKSFISSQFNYCPVVWMCHSRSLDKVNHIYEMAFCILYQDFESSFPALLVKDDSFTIR